MATTGPPTWATGAWAANAWAAGAWETDVVAGGAMGGNVSSQQTQWAIPPRVSRDWVTPIQAAPLTVTKP
jgi:hypothetical protein